MYPEPKNFFEILFEDLSDGDRDPNHLALAGPGSAAPRDLDPRPGPAAPERAGSATGWRSIKAALRRLDLLQQERAVLMMPEIGIRD